jgi:serine/threonine-protein kinase
MLVGQQLGPFLIEKELGSGAMGTVYRGRYTKTGQVVAVKVMTPGLGSTSASAAGRFEREAEILKQLKHPNIVRLFGHGKSHGTRFFAMEFIEGQSLDHVMARRDRMSWQEVVALGKQLCAALQHAHDKGIVHRDLKPSNLMVLSDGTVKLTDFGIAMDLDETHLTSTNCTVGTAAYMSPEQCRGERNLTHKSDLYSLGVVFYELITGQKPFKAENAMEMFLLHVQGELERPSRLVLDMPPWLDTLICQLLEKKPEHRPLDANMVANTLDSIQEKVEAQQSAGVDAARARMMDKRGPGSKRDRPTEEDRDAARTLLTGRGKKKSKKKKSRQLVWLQALGILFGLAGIIALLVIFLQPPSPEKLYKQAERMWASNNPDIRYQARTGPIQEYLERYRNVPGPQTDQIRQWAEDWDVEEKEKLLDRYRKWNAKGGIKPEARTDSDKESYEAALAEEDGDRVKARQLWAKVRERDDLGGWGPLARRHAAMLDKIGAKESELKRYYKEDVRDRNKEPNLTGPDLSAFTALRYEKFGDRRTAHKRFDALKKESANDSEKRFWFLFAAAKACELQKGLDNDPQTKDDRNKMVRKKIGKFEKDVNDATKEKNAKLNRPVLELMAFCMDVEKLYGQDPAFKDDIERVRALRQKIKAKFN